MAMADQSAERAEEQLTIRLELDAASAFEQDQAIVGEIGRDTLEALKQEAYTIRTVNTHTRGGEFVVDVLTFVWAHKEVIERAMTDLSSLVTVLGGVVPVMLLVVQAHKKRAIPGSAPLTFTLDIDGVSVSVEAVDIEQAEAVLLLAQKFHNSHPHIARQVSSRSKVKVKGKLPQQRRRGRR